MGSGHAEGLETDGVAHLEADRLSFRGDHRLVILLAEVASVSAEDGYLQVVTPAGTAVFCGLGPKAARWARAIRQPRPVIDKLGIRPGMRVAVVGFDEAEAAVFSTRIEAGGALVAATGCDAVFVCAQVRSDLDLLGEHAVSLKPGGALWVLRRKGPAGVGDTAVLSAGRGLGLVDVLVVAFSATWSAAKFVARREPASPRAHRVP